MSRLAGVGLLVLLLAVFAISPTASADLRIHLATRDLFADRLWDDGRAEYTTYRGTIDRYGVKRPLKARLIVVKEDMDIEQRVKSDKGPAPGRTWTVLKQNYSHDFTTGTYDYHQMSSAFLDRASGVLRKLTVSSQEGCGLTFATLTGGGLSVDRTVHSYWDGEGDRVETTSMSHGDPGRIVSGDALPLWLRRLDLERAQEFHVDLVPPQLSNRVQPLTFRLARVNVAGRADRYGLPVLVREENPPGREIRTDRYWFDRAWPHPLVRFEGGNDPMVLERVKTTRIAYWKKNAPGDERLLEP